MPRYEFGGGFAELVVAADASLSGALKAAPGTVLPPLYNKPHTDGTRTIVTDFLIDASGDGNLNDAVTSLTTDSDGYPPRFLGPNDVTPLYDLDGRILDPRNQDIAAVPLADETRQGTVEFGSDAETTALTITNRAVHPHGLGAVITAHTIDITAHPDLQAQLDQNTTAINNKADLVGGVVPSDQIASSTSPTADSLVMRTTAGAATGASATSDEELVPLLQMRTEIADSSAIGTEVRGGTEGAVPISLTSSTVYTALADPDVTVTTAASGEVYDLGYQVIYRGTTTNDLKVRFKSNTAAATNMLTNPSFEVNTTGWSSGPAASAIGRGTTGGVAADGTAYGTITALQTGTGTTWTSQLVPAAPGSVWTAAVECRTGTGTPRQQRIDIQFMDATGSSAVSTVLGTATTIVSGSWTRCLSNAAAGAGSVAPSGTFYARLRIITMAQAVNDVTYIDKAQLEPVAPIPAYGATGGGGSSALTVVGAWTHPAVGATAATDAPIRTILRTTPTDVVVSGAIGATTDAILAGMFRVTVGGTGLTNQLIGLEAAQNVTDAGNPTTIVYADATIARVL